MRLAVLIPAFNPGSALPRTLDSLSHDASPFDVYVVDDGSWPPVEAPRVVGAHPVVLLRHESNRGIAHALNAGLSRVLADGYDYVARLDAGDVNDPRRFARQTMYLDAHPDVALVGAWTRHVDDEGQQLFTTRYPDGWEAIRRRFHYRTAFSHPASMVRADVLRVAGVYDERFALGEDYELFWRVARRFRCENLQEVLVTRIETRQSLTHAHRATAARTRVRLQWQQFAWGSPDCWLGLARSFALFAVPARALITLKKTAGIVG